MTRIACCQLDVVQANLEANRDRLIRALAEVKGKEADLALFPECFLTGYGFSSLDEGRSVAITREETSLLQAEAESHNIIFLVGFAERTQEGLANTCALFEPGASPRFYQKTHLPWLGMDRFVTPGDSLPVFETRVGRIGILICFDQRPPEAARVLALKGADLICLPTNWPEGAEMSAHAISQARAAENRVCYATCNRVGTESGFRFIGASGIYDPNGQILAKAGSEEEIIYADLDLMKSRSKRAVIVPGEYEWTMDESRRPSLYGPLLDDVFPRTHP